MKKSIGKIVLFIFCVGVVVFLLLPFLEADNAASTAAVQDGKPTPQIFTSNPLTTIVKKLASLFRKNNKSGEKQPQQIALSNEQVNEKFGVPQYARGAAENSDDPELIASAGNNTAVNSDYYAEGEEDWVLIPQTSPDSSAPGMHEISVKDDAYETYVREQKAAAYNPALQIHAGGKHEQPSYWKRLVSPITNLFTSKDNLNGGAADRANPLGKGDQLSDGDNLLASAAGRPNNSPYKQPLEFSLPDRTTTPHAGQKIPPTKEQIQQGFSQAMDLLSQKSRLERVADMWATAKYPGPDQEKERQAAKARKLNEFQKALGNKTAELMNNLQGDPTTIYKNLEDILAGCNTPSLPAGKCETEDSSGGISQAETEQQALLAFQKASATFKEETGGLTLPKNVPITPVLGIISLDDLEKQGTETDGEADEDEDADENNGEGNANAPAELLEIQKQKQISKGIATFLFENNGCGGDNQCVWVANGVQNSPDLKDSIERNGQFFVGDPAGVYQKNEEAYIAQRVKNLGDVSKEEQKKEAEQAKKDYQKLAPAWIPYNEKTVQDRQKLSYSNLLQDNEDLSVFHLINGEQASKFSQMLGNDKRFFFSHAKDNGLQETSSAESESLMRDWVDTVNYIMGVADEVGGKAAEDIIHLGVAKGSETLASQEGNTLLNAKHLVESLNTKKK